jgi:hypothetical protein
MTSAQTLNGGHMSGDASTGGGGERSEQQFGIKFDDETGYQTSKICRLRHNYGEHPLMQLGRLQELAESLTLTDQCKFIPSGVSEATPFSHQSKSFDGRGVADIFRDIEKPGSWIALYNVETDPTYNRFLWDVMGSVAHLVSPQEKVRVMNGFFFISAPPAITPFHIDRENNFWLQVRGRKAIYVWDRSDRSIVSQDAVEDFVTRRWADKVKYREEFEAKAIAIDAGPGEGVYFPSTTPHMTRTNTSWVKPGDGVSISIGINFYSDETKRRSYVLALNRMLRKLGMSPNGPDESLLLDTLKYPFGIAAVQAQRVLRGYKPPPGF